MKTILIVDDVPTNLGVLLDFLADAGYEVLVAESGQGALSQLEFSRPDIILLDVLMPGLDGFETCRRLKADPRWRELPVLFLTALADAVDKVRGFDAGAVDFISKPLHPQEVLARVRAHLEIRALQQDLQEKNATLEQAIALRVEAEDQLQQSLDRAIIVTGVDGVMTFCTRLARRLLELHFPGGSGLARNRLPEPLRAWAAGGNAQGSWQSAPGDAEARLTARLFAEPGRSGMFILQLEEALPPGAAATPTALLRLGVTPREAEVLFWVAHGKTSPEIALILGTALNTVKKHVGNILLKLGVETRLAAALRAAEILGLPSITATGGEG